MTRISLYTRRMALTRLLLVVAMLCPALWAYPKRGFYDSYTHLPQKKLVTLGDDFLHRKGMFDSALVCYTIAADRYDKGGDKEQKALCVDACVGKWFIYFFKFFNYPKSIECLLTAKDIAEEAGIDRPDIYLNLGCTYQTIAEEGNDTAFCRKAADCFRQAVDMSFATGDLATLNMAMTNMLTMADRLGNMSAVEGVWQRYKRTDMKQFAKVSRFNVLLFEGLRGMKQSRWADAIKAFGRQVDICDGDRKLVRYMDAALINKAEAQAKAGDDAGAVATLRQAEQISVRHDLKDAKLEVFRAMSDCYKRLGDTPRHMEYREKYFDIKDTLLNYHQLMSVSEIHFLNDMKAMGDELSEMKYRHRVSNMLLYIFSAVSVIVLLFSATLYMKNQRLKQSNQMLYKKNEETLRHDTEQRAARKRLEGMAAKPASALGQNLQSAEEASPKTQKEATPDDEATEEIYAAIRNVMENNDQIYSPDFSAEALAGMVGMKQRYVSFAIKAKTGANFYSLLGEYRIKEACKRFRDDNYKNLTIEGIALSVGFKSRSNFCSTFKAITGLKPSEYIKMIKDGI